jgi:hypothetical protein
MVNTLLGPSWDQMVEYEAKLACVWYMIKNVTVGHFKCSFRFLTIDTGHLRKRQDEGRIEQQRRYCACIASPRLVIPLANCIFLRFCVITFPREKSLGAQRVTWRRAGPFWRANHTKIRRCLWHQVIRRYFAAHSQSL